MEERYNELQDKIFKLGISLIEEGNNINDYNISCLGDIMVTLSTAIDNDADMDMFSRYCSMYSAKKIMDNYSDDVDLDTLFNKIKKDIEGFDGDNDTDFNLDTDLDEDL